MHPCLGIPTFSADSRKIICVVLILSHAPLFQIDVKAMLKSSKLPFR